MSSSPSRLSANDLRQLPAPAATPTDCTCANLRCAGWESVPAPLGELLLRQLGTLRDPEDAEPTVQELRDNGSRYESAHAPVALTWFPYSRCDVWVCVACGCGFLQYTEFGGYYVDHRLRRLDPLLVV